jgi:hypothetical protein
VELRSNNAHIMPTPTVSRSFSSVPKAKINTKIDKKKNIIFEKRSVILL